MKTFFYILLFIFSFIYSYSQTEKVDQLSSELKRLTHELKTVDDRASILRDSIKFLENKISQEKLNLLTSKGFICETQTNSVANVRDNPAINGHQIFSIPSKSNIKVLEFMGNSYWKIQYEENVGFVNDVFLIKTDEMKFTEKSQGQTMDSKLSTNAISTSTTTSQSTNQSTSSSSYSSKTIYTGPRGGRYHYSSSGKKVYEKKK